MQSPMDVIARWLEVLDSWLRHFPANPVLMPLLPHLHLLQHTSLALCLALHPATHPLLGMGGTMTTQIPRATMQAALVFAT